MNISEQSLLNTPNLSLEPSSEVLQHMIELATKHIITHLESAHEMPSISNENGAELSQRLKEPLPQKGADFAELMEDLFQDVVPCSFNTIGPGHMGYIPGGGIVHSAIADLIANAVNRYVGIWLGAPGLVQLETNVLRWFCDMMGYPSEALGILTTGGSMANFSATIAARKDRLPENFLKGTLYVSDQTHHSVQKAAALAGFPPANVRVIPSIDKTFSINLDALRETIATDREAGWQPFMLIGSAGTTNTGAVDDLQTLASIAETENLWFHVDGAYGAFFMLTAAGKVCMSGIERADSITLDPHKGLFLPYGTGALLVRDQETLRKSHSGDADYLPDMQKNQDFVDYCNLSPELTRDFRGLRVWLPIKLHGIEPFRDNLEEKLQLTHWVTEELRKLDHIEIIAEPQLSTVAFRLKLPQMDNDSLNLLNNTLLDNILSKKRVILSGTMLGNIYVIRICVLAFRTHLDRVQQCLEDITSSIHELS
jgi:aromatic-L-amino-acid decarboxylase